jgi:uncharacterized membrane protein
MATTRAITDASPAAPKPLQDGPVAGGMHSYSAIATRRPRVDAVDLLRGLVMVIMLLDHTRDFVHWGAFVFDPTDLSRTSPALFMTRWVTHFCAPVFVFLAGTGAYLQLARGKTKTQLSRFLWTRGLWLIVLEFTVVRVLVFFDVDYRFLGMAQVIWAIGVSMIVLAALVRLPLRAVAAIGVSMIALHNLFDGIRVVPWQGPGSAVPSATAKLWMVLHQPGAFPVLGWPSPVVFALYPLIPWIGVMAAGYAFGAIYDWGPERRQRFLLRLGVVLTAAFVIIRATNLYGDPAEWTVQRSALFTVLSFVNTTKYPPSLLFLLMTLGPSLLALAWFERSGRNFAGQACVTFGRVPLFFYVMQWFTAHSLGVIAHALADKPWQRLIGVPFNAPPATSADGFGLTATYLLWLLGLVLLYPLCKWFAGVKARRRDWWLSYL